MQRQQSGTSFGDDIPDVDGGLHRPNRFGDKGDVVPCVVVYVLGALLQVRDEFLSVRGF